MTGFSADWLALREPFDASARAVAWPQLAASGDLVRWRASHAPGRPLAVLDLACGTGANLRALAARIGGAQRWRLVDHDANLLATLTQSMTAWAGAHGYRVDLPGGAGAGAHGMRITGPDFLVELAIDCRDLARDAADAVPQGTDLVTASALLDLVSARWLDALLQRACACQAAMLFALSVDGRTAWTPADAGDDRVHQLFAQHQRRDKGFGAALGPDAVPHACRTLGAAGYACTQARSDWVVGGDEKVAARLRLAMVDGMAHAATEQTPSAASDTQAWRLRRSNAAAHGGLTVGHLDLLALPAAAPDPGPTAGRVPSPPR